MTSDLGHADDAHDVAQEAFAVTFRRWDVIDEPSHYVRRVVANLAVSRIRSLVRERNTIAKLRSQPERYAELNADDGDFWKAVRALPKRQRQVIALFYLEDHSVARIAAMLDIAPGTVKATLAAGRSNLAELLRLDCSFTNAEESR